MCVYMSQKMYKPVFLLLLIFKIIFWRKKCCFDIVDSSSIKGSVIIDTRGFLNSRYILVI